MRNPYPAASANVNEKVLTARHLSQLRSGRPPPGHLTSRRHDAAMPYPRDAQLFWRTWTWPKSPINLSHFLIMLIGVGFGRRSARVNTPPPKGGGFKLRLKAGSVRHTADSGVTNSVTPRPRWCCRSTSLAATRRAQTTPSATEKEKRNDTAAPCLIPCRLKAWGFLIPYRGL